jgi:hypothetical protein
VSYTLIETCCGTSSLTLHMLGATKSLMSYQGSKWRWRFALQSVLEEMGFAGSPESVVLRDSGPWAIAIEQLLRPQCREVVVEQLVGMMSTDPRELYNELHKAMVPHQNPRRLATEFLFLQRLSYGGKAVYVKDGCWRAQGFNKSNAYGLPATESFGAVRPMLPALIRTLERLELEEVQLDCRMTDVVYDPLWVDGPTLAYIDPPYTDTTPYPGVALPRGEVVGLALELHEDGAAVMVSEKEPITELTTLGWKSKRLYTGRKDTSLFRGKHEEWVTYKEQR